MTEKAKKKGVSEKNRNQAVWAMKTELIWSPQGSLVKIKLGALLFCPRVICWLFRFRLQGEVVNALVEPQARPVVLPHDCDLQSSKVVSG